MPMTLTNSSNTAVTIIRNFAGKIISRANFILILSLILLYFLVAVSLFIAAVVGLFYAVDNFLDKPDSKSFVIAGGVGLAALAMIVTLIIESPEPTGCIVLSEEEEPLIYDFANKVSRDVNAKMADLIVLVPEWDIAVYQRIRLITAALFSKRVLVLGMMTLHTLSKEQLRSILAHEFAHFRHRDTAVHNLVTHVTR